MYRRRNRIIAGLVFAAALLLAVSAARVTGPIVARIGELDGPIQGWHNCGVVLPDGTWTRSDVKIEPGVTLRATAESINMRSSLVWQNETVEPGSTLVSAPGSRDELGAASNTVIVVTGQYPPLAITIRPTLTRLGDGTILLTVQFVTDDLPSFSLKRNGLTIWLRGADGRTLSHRWGSTRSRLTWDPDLHQLQIDLSEKELANTKQIKVIGVAVVDGETVDLNSPPVDLPPLPREPAP